MLFVFLSFSKVIRTFLHYYLASVATWRNQSDHRTCYYRVVLVVRLILVIGPTTTKCTAAASAADLDLRSRTSSIAIHNGYSTFIFTSSSTPHPHPE